MEMTNREIIAAVHGKLISAGPMDRKINRVCIDSREITAGDFFVPLTGERTDGHRFIEKAAQNGAIGCFAAYSAVVALPAGMSVIGVDDPLLALQKLAALYRSRFSLPVVAVTGSVGKTTTKDMIAATLSGSFKTLKTEGNLNNHIGLPLMLTRLDSTYQATVLEMGMSGFGEIDLLAKLAQPSIAVITNIGESHLEMLGSREGIAKAKCELLAHVPHTGTVVANADEPLLKPYLAETGSRVITFGFSAGATVRCTGLPEMNGKKTACIEQDGYEPLLIEPPLPGRHNLYNLMAALTVGRLLRVKDEDIVLGLQQVKLSGMRLEVVQTPDGIYVINDAYNASPTSTAAAIDVLLEKSGDTARIAVLGDMLELGTMEEAGHQQIGQLVAAQKLDALLVLGKRAQMIAEGALAAGYSSERVFRPQSHDDAAKILRKLARPGDWVLLKGSRGMRMEGVLTGLLEGIG
jgi:UDP-N-acetylmuramoyl-tripeptide--D-alanyl-D-alanine ligase